MKEPLSLYCIIPPQHTASFYYRLKVPLETARDLGLPVQAIVDTNDAGVSSEDRVRAFTESDIMLLYQPMGSQPLQNFKGIQGFLPTKRDNVWKYPPSIVLESDDNLFNVSPLNQAFGNLGVRDMAGNEIPLGHSIGIESNGEKRVLWIDGQKNFSLVANRQRIAAWKQMLEIADAVTVSTRNVAQAIEKECIPRRLEVFPNLVRFDHYEQVDIAQDPKRIKILWQGGSAHYEDWFPLKEALGRLTRKHPEIHWVIWGAQYPWAQQEIPPHRMTYLPWCAYQEYKLRLAMIGHDIALAPLQDNVFNRCRSAIKWYESSVLRKPVGVVAQRTGAYKEEMIDGETGLLFDTPEEFETQVSRLVEDAKLRKTLGQNSKQWISENRDAMKEVPKLVAFWERLREEKKKEQPHAGPEEWAAIEREAQEESVEV